jgi:Ca2+-binding RTX toxin-like protein
VLDIGDGSDMADVRLLGRVSRPPEGVGVGRIDGGTGNDNLRGSAGSFSWRFGWTGELRLLGGRGTDRLSGGRGYDDLRGGPGADTLAGGAGRDLIAGGQGNDRVRAADGSSDRISCQSGRDRGRLDGTDLPHGCERQIRTDPARAVVTDVYASNDDGEGDDHLEVSVACPIDAKQGCRSRVTAAVRGERTKSRRVRLSIDRVTRRGVHVTVSTQWRRRGALKFSARLPVIDNRYEGE